MIADSAVEIEALRWLVLTAAWQVDQGIDSRQAQSMAKLYGGVKANEIVDRVLQIHGGMGYTRELPVERWYRELRLLRIYEGTDEIQRRTIARNLLSGHAVRARPPRMTATRRAGSSGTPTTGTTGRSTTCSPPRARRRVSLVVPARNEAATVGDVVTRVRERAGRHRRSCSTRSSSSTPTPPTRRTPWPSDAGAIVHRSAEIRPDLGTQPGKGEAMWKSLFVTTGDVLVFMDADLTRLGHPLRARPARAAADPARGRAGQGVLRAADGRGEHAVPFEGGRVTELVARPLIPLLFPELGGPAPAARGGVGGPAVAVRVAVASRTGYAVELAALVDTSAAHGLDAIAQVDLGTRAHRHQSLRDLGGMATQILAAALAPRRHRSGASTSGHRRRTSG